MKLKLAFYREKAGLTQSQLAEIAGVSPKTEWNWEQGKSFPNAAQLWDMSIALGTDPNDIMGWWDEHQRDEARPLSQDESVLVSDYRECTPDRRRKAAEAVRDQRSLSQAQEGAGASFENMESEVA